MSDAVKIAIINGFFSNVGTWISAVFLGVAAVMTALSRRDTKQNTKAVEEVKKVAKDSQNVAHQAKRATVVLQDQQDYMVKAIATNTFSPSDMAALRAQGEKR